MRQCELSYRKVTQQDWYDNRFNVLNSREKLLSIYSRVISSNVTRFLRSFDHFVSPKIHKDLWWEHLLLLLIHILLGLLVFLSASLLSLKYVCLLFVGTRVSLFNYWRARCYPIPIAFLSRRMSYPCIQTWIRRKHLSRPTCFSWKQEFPRLHC